MSDNIPFDIQSEIMKGLPVRSLIQFRSVSKAWKSLIDSSDFIARYSGQQQRLFVSYYFSVDVERRYASIVDDDTFPHHKVSVTLPPLVKMLEHSSRVCSSHGLLCLYDDYPDGPMGRAVLWNPSIRKAVAVVVPNVAGGIYATVLGFGVRPETNDPKIVKIRYISRPSDMESITHIPWQVEVFTLSKGAWRSPYGSNLPRKSIIFCRLQLRESLVVLEYNIEANNLVTGVWIMGDGVLKLFTKLFTINVNAPYAFVKGFRKSGEPIIEIVKRYHGWFHVTSLVVFEPYSKHINHLGISGFARPSCVYPYVETLLLLDQPDSIIYNNVFIYRKMQTIQFNTIGTSLDPLVLLDIGVKSVYLLSGSLNDFLDDFDYYS
ncbi:hypothetical protein L1987_46237 [Smallanthus sonchifolius]|uniref:Uncharacterized protein n=1 Tax=Smallanthus sonchifolius TaxID=185202 RepID=A0ACB9FZ65_9ASTR|nr:hypothetical protein L1987_46237 [Smallanthus sonchifolius]